MAGRAVFLQPRGIKVNEERGEFTSDPAPVQREAPVQVPMDPAAGFLAEVPAGPKPDKIGERMMRCLGMVDLTWRERTVLAAVAYHDGDGGAYPSQERLAIMLGMRLSRVNETIQNLGAKGRLKWEAHHGSARAPNEYTLAYGEPFESGGRIPQKAESGEQFPLSAKTAPHVPRKAEWNRKEPRASRSAMNKEAGADLCQYAAAAPRRGSGSARPATCRHALGVEVGEKCLRCGWHREIE